MLRARRLLVATRLRDELPDLPGVRERWGKDLLHCPYCHAYEVRDQPLAVLGTHPGAVHQVLLLRQWSKDAVFVMRGGVGVAVPQPQRLGVAVAGQVLDRQMGQRSLDDGEFAFMVGP